MRAIAFVFALLAHGGNGRRVDAARKRTQRRSSSHSDKVDGAAGAYSSFKAVAGCVLRCDPLAGWRIASAGPGSHFGTSMRISRSPAVEMLFSGKSRSLYQNCNRNSDGTLKVDSIHSIYWQEYGNTKGRPALFLHGGPGAACFPNHAKFFDPSFYRIVLVDQRGCGKSTPYAELENNDTPHLVSDLEVLRKHFNFTAWHVVLGGSWGSTLALAYAQMKPSRVRSLVLRGVCCMRSQEIDWIFGDHGGARKLRPSDWSAFAKHVSLESIPAEADTAPPGVQKSSGRGGPGMGAEESPQEEDEAVDGKAVGKYPFIDRQVLLAYYDRLLSRSKQTQSNAASQFNGWDMKIYSHKGDPASEAGVMLWNGTAWSKRDLNDCFLSTLSEAEVRNQVQSVDRFPAPEPKKWPKEWSELHRAKLKEASKKKPWFFGGNAQAMLTCHYAVHNAFMDDDELIRGAEAIRNIPCIAVQGAADFVTPPATALDLLEVWPEMELRIVLNSGHSMYDSGISSQLVMATDKLKELVT